MEISVHQLTEDRSHCLMCHAHPRTLQCHCSGILQALRWHCMGNSCRYAPYSHTGSGIPWKTISPNAACCSIKWTHSGHMFCGQLSPRFSWFWKKKTRLVLFYVPGMRKTIQGAISERCKKQFVTVWGGIIVQCMDDWWRGVYWNFGDLCYHEDDMFSWEIRSYLSRIMADLVLHNWQQPGFIDKDCVCYTGLIMKMYGESWRGESDNTTRESWAGTLYSARMDKYPLPTL